MSSRTETGAAPRFTDSMVEGPSIVQTRPASHREWDRAWRESPGATFFHSREWAEIWARYSRSRPDPRIIEFSDGVSLVLPLTRLSGGPFTRLVSSAAGTFGGWLTERPLPLVHQRLVLDHLRASAGSFVWRVNPYDPPDRSVFDGCSIREESTQALDLRGGFDAVLAGWTKGHKHAARVAQGAGIVVREASAGSDWDQYYALYRETAERWGANASVVFGPGLFHAIREVRSSNIRLWLAWHPDGLAAGALVFEARHHAVYWHGASSLALRSARPVHLLLREAIRHACDRGLDWFDLNPSGGQEGVRSFKSHFGALELPAPVVTYHTPAVRALERLWRGSRRLYRRLSAGSLRGGTEVFSPDGRAGFEPNRA